MFGRLDKTRRRLLRQATSDSRPERTLRLRCGAVQAAVEQVVSAASEAMSVSEAHQAVEHLLAQPVSRSTVNSCLSVGARGSSPRFERVRLGWYRRSSKG